MANKARLELMVKMLREVEAGTWRAAEVEVLRGDDPEDHVSAEELPNIKHWLDMNTWISTDGPPKQCGYNACAVGHACLDSRFIEQGLKFDSFGAEPVFKRWDSFDAVEAFFEIPHELAEKFFMPQEPANGWVNAATVADTIQAWINENLL